MGKNGWGGISFALPANADINNASVVVLADTLSVGLHDLYIRAHTQSDEYSHTNIILNIDRSEVLPVDWLYFDAVKRGNDAQLNWTISNAINASHFDIESRTSPSIGFEYVGQESIVEEKKKSVGHLI